MSILHEAIFFNKPQMVDFILMTAKNVDINLMSPTYGNPLHIACKVGNIKIVQKLVLSGADITAKDAKTQKLPKEFTENQKIIYLLEKYVKMQEMIKKRNEEKKEAGEKSDSSGDESQMTSSVYMVQDEWLDKNENELENQQAMQGSFVSNLSVP